MDKDSPRPTNRPTLSLKTRRKPAAAPEPPAKPKEQEAVAASPPAAPKQGKPAPQPRTIDDTAQKLMGWLGQHSAVWRDGLPLNIGVIAEVYALLEAHGMQGTYSKRAIHKALQWHTGRMDYQHSLLSHPHRYNLAGQVGGEVTDAQRGHAQAVLDGHKNRKKKPANSTYT
jgi:hypothetical protein